MDLIQNSKSSGKPKVAITIPIYKSFEELTRNEIQALLQIKSVLNSRDIFLLHPSFVDIKKFTDLFLPLKAMPLRIKDKYFGNQERSNLLFLSYNLYSQFSEYDYMLTYHIDAYVFSDQLDYWCNRDLDYIGAPWFVGNHHPTYPLKFKGVGNGGFSLRRISSFKKIAKDRSLVILHRALYRLHKFLEGSSYQLLRKVMGLNYFLKLIEPMIGYEDEFWGLIVPRYYKWFKVAAPEEALRFSFEVLPQELCKLNNNRLPCGCHAWEKYGPDFWGKFIRPLTDLEERASPIL